MTGQEVIDKLEHAMNNHMVGLDEDWYNTVADIVESAIMHGYDEDNARIQEQSDVS